MRSLSNAITHSVSYINTFKNNNEKHINDIKKIYDDIIDMDTSDEDYIGILREKIDKFKDDYDKPQHIHNVIYNLLRTMGANKLSKIIREVDSFDAVYLKGKQLKML